MDTPKSVRAPRPAAADQPRTVAVAFVLSIPDDAKHLGARPGFILLYAAGVALLLPSVIASGPGQWLLSGRTVSFVGERSYSVYLVQDAAALVVGATVPSLVIPRTLTGIVVALGAVAMAELLYRLG